MIAGASVEGRDRARLFVGLPLPPEPARELSRWQQAELGGREGLRLVEERNLHATVAFLGSRPVADIEAIGRALRTAAAAAEPLVLTPTRYRETRTVGMIVFADEEDRGARLAEAVWEGLERLGVYEREARPWLAHVTVARFRRRPRLQPALPDLGPVGPSEVALYHSVLRPHGAQYEILHSVALGGSPL